MRLLLLDNLTAKGSSTARLLRRYGYEVVTVGSCLEASAVASRFDCGVFALDLVDGDVIALAERLRNNGVIARAIFLSPHPECDPLAEQARSIGPVVDRRQGIAELDRTISVRRGRSQSHLRIKASVDDDSVASAPSRRN